MPRKRSTTAKDRHHILYQHGNWNGRWAKRLRNHPYMKIRIPACTLHVRIHNRVQNIPCPPETVCESIYYDLNELMLDKYISKADGIEQRLNVLIQLLAGYAEGGHYNLAPTLTNLRWQRQIVRCFYNGS